MEPPEAGRDFSDDDLIQLSLLRDEETDELIDACLLDCERRLESPLDAPLCLNFDGLALQVTAGPYYPVAVPEYTVINLSLSRKDVDALRLRLRAVIARAAETNNVDKWLDRENSEYGIFQATKVVLEMAREADALVREIRSRNRVEEAESDLPWLKKKPVETLSSSELALRYLGKTAKEICDTIPQQYRVLHVEEVLRRDLAAKFDRCQSDMRARLMAHGGGALNRFVPRELHGACHKDKVEHLVRPRVTFHGTQRHFVSSIVRYGFIKPGSKVPGSGEMHGVRCGSTYGRGIYSSPSAEFSLSYSDWTGTATRPDEFFGLKLLVCAVVMGRTRLMFRDDEWRSQTEPFEGADSHVANRELEYIVFSPAQIIPVYVVHLDWGDDNALHFSSLPHNPRLWTPAVASSRSRARLDVNEGLDSQYAGERQRARQAVLAKAAKYFPYGYGPATGGRFVVEEVGEVDDDEEDYGDYQALRVEEDRERTATSDFWGWVKAAEEDEVVMNDTPNEYERYTGFRPANWDEIERADKPVERTEEDEDFYLERLMLGEGPWT